MPNHTLSKSALSRYFQNGKIPASLSKLLNLHIDSLYRHSEVYDLAYNGQKGDKNFYVAESKRGKVLYLGIGSGRIFKKIASVNSNAYGLDFSKQMIEKLNLGEDFTKKRMIFANVLTAKIKPNSFSKIIAPYCFLNQFEYDEAVQILKNCYKWLEPGGEIITDFFSPFKNPKNSNYLLHKRKIKKQSVYSYEIYDFVKQELLELTFIDTSKRKMFLSLQLFYYFPNEVVKMFKEAGFKKSYIYGGFKKNSLTTKSEVIVCSCNKPVNKKS